ncbi:TonB-dependent receptor [Congregibacter litoralis]|uniref:Outer membrane receptor protein, mostly Fe transport n=1 Tax=Congregibacter litoralis KT71 TaxID=314285 RepID=A4ABA4_9GAMM|nr:TonB-dependent receptor [Congregibacter litoralis]EAQ96658.1 Outer membrane receptor protein, mostly Fe transport [Congregibacter litoralis KT71]
MAVAVCQATDGTPEHTVFSFHIPAQSADVSLTEYAKVTNRSVLFLFDEVKQYKTNELTGEYTASEAIVLLLKDTPLQFTVSDQGNLIIKLNSNLEGKHPVKKTKLAAFLSTLFAASGAGAEIAPSPASALIEEVLVTAQKKSAAESVQDVPIAITAMSGAKIEAMHAVTLTDIGLSTPNANFSPVGTIPGVANFVIRGMGTVGQSVPSADPAVGVVMDGISYGTIFGVVTDLFDLDTIEILRGPQGTLFGRNVTGGAVVMRSVRPGDEFEGKVRVGGGNYNLTDLAASLSGPLTEQVGGKLAVMYKEHDGYFDNKTLGGKQGESSSLLVRPALTYTGESFNGAAIFEYGEMDTDGVGGQAFEVDGVRIGNPYSDRLTYQNENGDNNLEWFNVMLEGNWDLGNGVLTSVFGYRDVEQDVTSDVDGWTDTRIHFKDTAFDQDQSSLEIRWAGDLSDTTSLTAGAYYFDQTYTYAERRLLVDAVDRRGVSTIDHDTAAVFAQADFRLGQNLGLTLGGRYTQENKDAEIGLIGDPAATGDCATKGTPFEENTSFNDCRPFFSDSESWSNFTPKAGLAYDINDDVMAYASYTRGFRSGGYNARFTDLSGNSTPGPYDEEVADAFEIGLKSTLWDGRGRLNLAAFNNKYDDLQRTTLTENAVQEIVNAASATVRGVEVEAMAAVTDNLVLEASVGWTDATYDEFDAAEEATGKSADELKFVMVPETTTNLAATYDMTLGDLGYLSWRLSYSYVSESYGNDFNTIELKAYELYNASVAFTSANEKLKLSLYGRNLKDEVYYNLGVELLGVKSNYLTPPRTYGAELTYQF